MENRWSESLIINNKPSWHIKVLTKWIDTACQHQCITYAHRSRKIDMVSVLVSSRLNRTNRVFPGILISRPLSASFLSAQELLYHKLKNCSISNPIPYRYTFILMIYIESEEFLIKEWLEICSNKSKNIYYRIFRFANRINAVYRMTYIYIPITDYWSKI